MLRTQFESEGSFVGVQTKFNYAWGLIKSNRRSEQQLGVRLLTEIFRDHVERRRECLYYLALGHYRLGNYAEARRYNDTLLGNEPGNLQARSLRSLVDEKVAKGECEDAGRVGRGLTGNRGLARCCDRVGRCACGGDCGEHGVEGVG